MSVKSKLRNSGKRKETNDRMKGVAAIANAILANEGSIRIATDTGFEEIERSDFVVKSKEQILWGEGNTFPLERRLSFADQAKLSAFINANNVAQKTADGAQDLI